MKLISHLTRNFGPKLLAVLLAVLTWFVVQTPSPPVSLPIKASLPLSTTTTTQDDQTTVQATPITARSASGTIRRTVGVTIATMGSPPAGWVIGRLTVSPSVVTIAGTANQLNTVEALRTEPIILGQLAGSSAVTVRLVVPKGITLVDDSGTASVFIELYSAL